MRFKEFLLETPLPDDWNKDVFKSDVPFNEKLEYAMQRALMLGQGSSRVAFEIEYEGRLTVLKIAKNDKGIMQNKAELKALHDPFNKQLHLFIPLIDGDKDGNWIHVEHALDVSLTDFHKELNVPLDKFIDFFINFRKSLLGGNVLGQLVAFVSQINTKSQVFRKMEHFVDHNARNPDLVLGDYMAPENWGKYKGQLVIIDAGFDKAVHDRYEISHKNRQKLAQQNKLELEKQREQDKKGSLKESQDQNHETTWYHGKQKDVTSLRPGLSGEDIWGAGIYLTTSYKHALEYAFDKNTRKGKGFVYTVQQTVSNPIYCSDTVSAEDIAKMDKAGIVHPGVDESSSVLKLVKVLKEKYGVKQLSQIFQHLGYDGMYTPNTHDTRAQQLVVYDSHNTTIISKTPVER